MDKSLKKLRRGELQELVVQLSDEYENLARENNRLKQKLTQRRLPRNAKVGSIAEAALQANGYFEAAQRSADEYLREIKCLRDELVLRSNRTPEEARDIVSSAQEQMRLKNQAQVQAQKTIKDAQERANKIVASAQAQARAIMQEAQTHIGRREVQPIAPMRTERQAAQRAAQQNTRQAQSLADRRDPNMVQGSHSAQANQAQQARRAQYAQQQRSGRGAHQRVAQERSGQYVADSRLQEQQQRRVARRAQQSASYDPANPMGYRNMHPRPSTSSQ